VHTHTPSTLVIISRVTPDLARYSKKEASKIVKVRKNRLIAIFVTSPQCYFEEKSMKESQHSLFTILFLLVIDT